MLKVLLFVFILIPLTTYFPFVYFILNVNDRFTWNKFKYLKKWSKLKKKWNTSRTKVLRRTLCRLEFFKHRCESCLCDSKESFEKNDRDLRKDQRKLKK